jgi:hypothetical protein
VVGGRGRLDWEGSVACADILVIECQSCGREEEIRRPNLGDPRVADRLGRCVACGRARVDRGDAVLEGPLWYWWSACA